MAEAGRQKPVFSARLEALLQEAVKSPAANAGRLCGYCYDPLPPGRRRCNHCGLATSARPPADHIPSEVIAMFKAKRRREAWAVRSTFVGGLIVGLALAVLLMAILPGWWKIVAFFLVLGAGYVAAANLANWLGDAIGYRWGQNTLDRRWRQFLARKDSQTEEPC